jgi:CxxC motif-containing protein (DUF1111 family)
MNKLLIILACIVLPACGGSSSRSSESLPQQSLESRVWHPVAGSATLSADSEQSFLQFIPELDLSRLAVASRGRELFVAQWTAAPGPRPLLDGLGPLTITPSCADCHLSSGRAESLKGNGEIGVGLLFRLRDAGGNADPYYGGQLQTLSTTGSSEGSVSWELSSAGIPRFTIEPNAVALTEGINPGPRLSPHLAGIGLLELVTNEQILEYEDVEDLNSDGISGRAHWHQDGESKKLGRFGWKSMQPTLRGQSAGAMQQDMGLTTSINPTEPCTVHQTICGEQTNGGSPEVSDESLDAINEFLTFLAVPARRISNQQRFDQGAHIFDQIGCSLCHRATLMTSGTSNYVELASQLIYPYTDLLLHDMGEDLNDGVKEGDAAPSEWRTPPLWSIGLIEPVPGSRFLHDGRAADIPAAIKWHGGEGEDSRKKYEALTEEDKAKLLGFLRSI